MAISGSIKLEGLEITGSYTNISNFTYNNQNDSKHINYTYQIYVSEEHRQSGRSSLKQANGSFFTTSSEDIFGQMYNDMKKFRHFSSGSIENC